MANPPLSSTTSFSKPQSTPNKDLETGSTRSSQFNPPAEIPWGPSHPCFPHLNPHVPLSSSLSTSTRIIRIRRDWMISGDLAPCFSNIYPEILEPWVSEQDFRILIRTVNEGLIEAFRPDGWRAWGDAVLGLATGWLWEDLGYAAVKGKVRGVEGFIEEWNAGRVRRKDEGDEEQVKVVPLRRTGYLSVNLPPPLRTIFLLFTLIPSSYHEQSISSANPSSSFPARHPNPRSPRWCRRRRSEQRAVPDGSELACRRGLVIWLGWDGMGEVGLCWLECRAEVFNFFHR